MSQPEKGFERLAPPAPGEWRSLFKEREQSFEAYVSRCALPKSAAQQAILLQPLGDAARRYAATIRLLRDYAAIYFGAQVRILAPMPLFEKAHALPRDQHNSSMILGELADRVPADAIALLGLTDRDLFARGKNYVFGEGSYENRAGIHSLARLETPDAALFTRRTFRLATHEIGHLLGIDHCVTHRCVMQGSNTLDESDRHPLHLCLKDLRKLEWCTGVDRQRRYRELEAFYAKAGMGEEAAWVADRTG
jgi:archaemetzincin